MYKFKRMFALLLVLSLVLTLGVTVSANSPDFDALYAQVHAEEMRRINEVLNAPITATPPNSKAQNLLSLPEVSIVDVKSNAASPRLHGHCTKCSSFTVYVCNGDANWYDTGTHYDLSNFSDCTVRYLNSGGHRMCQSCFTVYEELGTHDCWEVHLTCSKGQYDVCILDIT